MRLAASTAPTATTSSLVPLLTRIVAAGATHPTSLTMAAIRIVVRFFLRRTGIATLTGRCVLHVCHGRSPLLKVSAGRTPTTYGGPHPVTRGEGAHTPCPQPIVPHGFHPTTKRLTEPSPRPGMHTTLDNREQHP